MSNDQAQLRPLILYCNIVSVHGAREAALRGERELLQRHIFCGFFDASTKLSLIFQLAEFCCDQASDDGLALGQKPQRPEVAGACIIVFQK